MQRKLDPVRHAVKAGLQGAGCQGRCLQAMQAQPRLCHVCQAVRVGDARSKALAQLLASMVGAAMHVRPCAAACEGGDARRGLLCLPATKAQTLPALFCKLCSHVLSSSCVHCPFLSS